MSMKTRAEVTTRYAKAYAKASKKDRGRILDAVLSVTDWSRDNDFASVGRGRGARGTCTPRATGKLEQPP